MHLIEITSTPAVAGDRDTVGGWPVLDAGRAWPRCGCGRQMVLFLQFDVPPDVAVVGGEHVLAFQCPAHNDACLPPLDSRLPPR